MNPYWTGFIDKFIKGRNIIVKYNTESTLMNSINAIV